MRKVKVRINYKDILVTIREAETLCSILDGATVVDNNWINGETIHYIRDEPYQLRMEFTEGTELYKTEEQVRMLLEAAAAAKEEEANA